MNTLQTVLTAGQIAGLTWLFVQTGQQVNNLMGNYPPNFWWLWGSAWLNVILLVCIYALRKPPKK
jgi:hypothetical protein